MKQLTTISGPFEMKFIIDSLTSFKTEVFIEKGTVGKTLNAKEVKLEKDDLTIILGAFERKQIIEFKGKDGAGNCVITAIHTNNENISEIDFYPLQV
jgi:phosphate-selective porin